MANFLKKVLGKKDATPAASPTEATTIEDLDPKKNAEPGPGRSGGAFVAAPIPDLPGGGSSGSETANAGASQVSEADALGEGSRALRDQGYGLDRDGGAPGEWGRALREEGYGLDREAGVQQVSANAVEAPPAPPVAEAPAADAGWSEADAQEALQQVAEERAAANEALQQATAEHAEAEQALHEAAAEYGEAEQALQEATEQQASTGPAEPPEGEPDVPEGEPPSEGEPAAAESDAAMDEAIDVDSSSEMTDFDDDGPSTLLDMDTSTVESPVLAGAAFDADDFAAVDDVDPDVESLEL